MKTHRWAGGDCKFALGLRLKPDRFPMSSGSLWQTFRAAQRALAATLLSADVAMPCSTGRNTAERAAPHLQLDARSSITRFCVRPCNCYGQLCAAAQLPTAFPSSDRRCCGSC